MSSTMVINWNINAREPSQQNMQKYISEFKKLRPYYMCDYYPLTGKENLATDSIWLAYQMNRPEKGDGIIMAFRRVGAPEKSIRIKLKGLEKKSNYSLKDADSAKTWIKTGEELMSGIDISLEEKPGSLLVNYQREP